MGGLMLTDTDRPDISGTTGRDGLHTSLCCREGKVGGGGMSYCHENKCRVRREKIRDI